MCFVTQQSSRYHVNRDNSAQTHPICSFYLKVATSCHSPNRSILSLLLTHHLFDQLLLLMMNYTAFQRTRFSLFIR